MAEPEAAAASSDPAAVIAANHNEYIANRTPIPTIGDVVPQPLSIPAEHLDADLWKYIESGGSNVLAFFAQLLRNTHFDSISESPTKPQGDSSA